MRAGVSPGRFSASNGWGRVRLAVHGLGAEKAFPNAVGGDDVDAAHPRHQEIAQDQAVARFVEGLQVWLRVS